MALFYFELAVNGQSKNLIQKYVLNREKRSDMQKSTQNNLAVKVSVAVYATRALVNKSLQILLENHGNQVAVAALAGSTDELLKQITQQKPGIILICVDDHDRDVMKVIPELSKISPDARIILLTGPNIFKSSAEARKLGAAGIVGLNQSVNVLIHAIEQVSQGKTWLEQKLVKKLFEENNEYTNGGQTDSSGDLLTKRELEVVTLIGVGMNNKQIAKKLFISETTVRHHLSSIYSKLNVNDRLGLVIHAYQNGILQVPDEIH